MALSQTEVSAKRFRFWNTSRRPVPNNSLRLRERNAEDVEETTHANADPVDANTAIDEQPSGHIGSGWQSIWAQVEVALEGGPVLTAAVEIPEDAGLEIEDIWAHVYLCEGVHHLQVGGYFLNNGGELVPLPCAHDDQAEDEAAA